MGERGAVTDDAMRMNERGGRAQVKFEPTEPTFLTQFTMQREKAKATMESVEDQERVVRQVVGMLGGSLKSFYVTQTGPYDGLCVYTFPKNHDSRTLTCLLRSMVGCDRIETTKLMSSTDAAMSAKAAAQLYKTLKK